MYAVSGVQCTMYNKVYSVTVYGYTKSSDGAALPEQRLMFWSRALATATRHKKGMAKAASKKVAT